MVDFEYAYYVLMHTLTSPSKIKTFIWNHHKSKGYWIRSDHSILFMNIYIGIILSIAYALLAQNSIIQSIFWNLFIFCGIIIIGLGIVQIIIGKFILKNFFNF